MFEKLIDHSFLLRQETFRQFIEKGEAHLGGSFSIIEMLVALYDEILEERDKFILSKAHASFPLCVLLRERGMNLDVTTHLELDPANGIHCTTGSLGHGLPIATGMAMARKRKNHAGRIYVMISDGECQEGTTWESLLIGAKHKLNNLIVLVDYNRIQALTSLEDALPLDNLAAKFESFNWTCTEVFNGHNFEELIPALNVDDSIESPRAIIVHTIKGKGVKAFENDPAWHARKIKGAELEVGKLELGLE
jgi:transketolase